MGRVTLLFQDIHFLPPIPHQQLAKLGRSDCNPIPGICIHSSSSCLSSKMLQSQVCEVAQPVTLTIESHRGNAVTSDAEHLQVREVWHLVQFHDPRAVCSYQDPAFPMEVHSCNLTTSQLQELPADQPPLPFCTLVTVLSGGLLEAWKVTPQISEHGRACELRFGLHVHIVSR